MSTATAFEASFLVEGIRSTAPPAARRWVELTATILGGESSEERYHTVVWFAQRGVLAPLVRTLSDFATAEPRPRRRHSASAALALRRHLGAFDAALAALDARTGRPDTTERLRAAFNGADPLTRCNSAAVLAVLLAGVYA